MSSEVPRAAEPPAEATALLVDLRDFTPNLNAAPGDERGINTFCHFLAEFYALCLEAALLSLPAELRASPPISVNGTGDGMLIVFTGPGNFRQGYLAAVLLNGALRRLCEEHNARRERRDAPRVWFGIGIESGAVSRVTAQPGAGPGVDTPIGHCINVAARAEAVSKTLYNAFTVVADGIVERLARGLYGTSFADLRTLEEAPALSDEERLRLHDRMSELNRHLCLGYINHHVLKGVPAPMPLYRLSQSSCRLGNPRFEELLGKLVDGSGEHRQEVLGFLRQRA